MSYLTPEAKSKLSSTIRALRERLLTDLHNALGRFGANNEGILTQEVDNELILPHGSQAHLRKQRYGKELESWKYVWIKETTIHKDKYQYSPNDYRIYEVAPTLT